MQINIFNSFVALAAILLIVTGNVSGTRHFPYLIESDSLNIAFKQPNARAVVDRGSLGNRLPNETYPTHYDITLKTNIHKCENDFEGKVIIDIVVVKGTYKIVLHAYELESSKVTITNSAIGETEELSVEYNKNFQLLILTRKNTKKFESDTEWKLTIYYASVLRRDGKGFYLSTYKDDHGITRCLATTQFESTSARFAFPCYDEPGKRAKFTITIEHDPSYNAISNMPVDEARSSNGRTVFLTTAPIPTYIVAFIVSDFESTGGSLKNVSQHVYSRSNAKNSHLWPLVSSMLITQSLSEYLGVDFMLPKLDHVAVPDFFSGGMENWGLATYTENALLYENHKTTIFKQNQLATLLAHEIAHQWFGDFVGIKWWTHLWIKEGFANLLSYRALSDAYPEWGVWQAFHTDIYQSSLINDGSKDPEPMTYYVEELTDIAQHYGYVTYSKAAAVLNMWSHALSQKVFQRGLYNYLTINQYTATDEDQLFTAIQIAAKEENYKIAATINETMSSWTHQGGFPLLTVTRNYEDGSFTVEQAAYHDDEDVIDKKTWFVPINYAVKSEADFRNTEATNYLLNVRETKVQAGIDKNDWLILNKQSAYYYRIRYDVENYKLIIKALIERPYQIHAHNRAQLIHDLYIFTFTHHQFDHDLLLEMMVYLKKEDQYAPWSTANNIIFKTFDKYLRGQQNYNDFKFFIADIVEPMFRKLNIDDVSGEQHYQKNTRNYIINLACLAGVEDCLHETSEKLKAYVKNHTPIEPNLQETIFCNGLLKSGDEEFNFLYDQLMTSIDKTFRRQIMTALGCSQNKNHLKKYLNILVNNSSKFQPDELQILMKTVYSRSEIGLLTCIEFMDDNSLWRYDLGLMAHYVVNKNQEEKYLALLEKLKDKSLAPEVEVYGKEKISSNFKWLKVNGDPLMAWFKQYNTEKLPNGSSVVTAPALLIAFAFISVVIRLF